MLAFTEDLAKYVYACHIPFGITSMFGSPDTVANPPSTSTFC